MSLAIEALRQICETSGKRFEGVKLRDVDIKTALVVPDDDDGVEVILNLQSPTEPASSWYKFSIETPGTDGEWTVHCNGRISAVDECQSSQISHRSPVDESALTQRVSARRWYDAFHRVGFHYGAAFQELQYARTARTLHHAAGNVEVRECCPEKLQGESRYLVHPTTIDACLQLIIISVHAGKHKEMPWGVVPTRLEEVTLFPAEVGRETSIGHAVAWTDGFEGRRFNTNVQLRGADGRVLWDMKNITCTAYEAALPATSDGAGAGAEGPEPFSVVSWKPDIETLRNDDMDLLWPGISSSAEKLSKLADLIAHHQNISNAIIVVPAYAPTTQALVDAILEVVPLEAAITIGITAGSPEDVVLSDSVRARLQIISLGIDPDNWAEASNGPHDLVVVDSHAQSLETQYFESLLRLVCNNGWLIYPSLELSSTLPSLASSAALQLGGHTLLRKTVASADSNGMNSHPDLGEGITVLSAPSVQSSQDFGEALPMLQSRFPVYEKAMSEFVQGQNGPVIVNDLAGAVSASILDNEDQFEAFKYLLTSGVPVLWLTQGIRQGRPVGDLRAAGMAEGLLRVLRSEQAAVRVTLLDMNSDEEPHDVCRAIIHTLGSIATKDSGCDTELWLHQGIMFTSRVYAHDSLNQDLRKHQPQKATLSGPLKLADKTADGQFVFESPGEREPAALRDDQVEIEVLSSCWPSYSQGSRTLVAGTVVRTGASVNENHVGKRVITFTYDTLRMVFLTSAYAIVDDEYHEVSSEMLLHTMSSLCPLVHLCIGSAKLERGDTIISLPGPEKDITMLARLSTAMDWRLSVVTQTEKDRGLYTSLTGLEAGRIVYGDDANQINTFIHDQAERSPSRVVTIVGHDFSTPLSQEIWRQIPPSCRFLLLNEKLLETPLEPLPFSRGASFISSSMRYLRESANATSCLLRMTLDLVKTHPSLLELDEPHSVDIEDARQLSVKYNIKDSSDSSMVVRYRPQTSQILVRFLIRHELIDSLQCLSVWTI